jgi:D-amino-acid dehydrogenase
VAGHVVVVGGGVVGCGAAYALARRGVRVTLVDRADDGQATAAGAGIVAPGTVLSASPGWYPLAFGGAAYYPELLASLAEDGIADAGYTVTGGLFIAEDDAERERLAGVCRLLRERAGAGVPNLGEVSPADEAAVRELCPALAPGVTGVHMSGVGRVNGRLLRDALSQAIRRLGGQLLRAGAEVAVRSGRAKGVVTGDGEEIGADAVILATGAWPDAWAGLPGQAVAVRPQRGQILHLDLPGSGAADWPVIEGFTDPYLLGFPPHRVVAGATREDGTGFDHRVTAAGQHWLLDRALGRAPGLAEATVTETRVGFRPVTPDGLPVLGRAPEADNVWFATGTAAEGLTMGTYLGALAAGLACGEPLPLDGAPYDPARFRPAPPA